MTSTTTTSREPTDARLVARRRLLDGSGIGYPAELPITARRDELLDVLRSHQVVIVAGETGSGKSTQLPKLLLEAGRGTAGIIGHTQPRRVAARTIAERVADELAVPLGDLVGYTVRFTDRVADQTAIRVMTDGILLAELQRDPELRRYDALIIDEAHERSLNIDFLLGYLRQLLPRRPDLQLVVTSATIDTQRFAEHFARDGVPAPIVEVSGRTYPVEIRYRPFGPARSDQPDDRDQVQAILDAVDELADEGRGDVLVFLSGEREIRDVADALRRLDRPGLEVLPLYARLSASEQHRIFAPHRGRRVVVSTNVAETSITVPGVRYVVDAGTARISRYSRRLKVQRLPIEPISRASADQRAGRCGRVAPGICIRLYEEDDYASRPEFTEPEVLRTNLASVVLQMTALGLGDVRSFPFVEAPDTRAVRDGYALLDELGAIRGSGDDPPRLTRVGRRLARLPVDPRLGRMVLEAEREGAVREVLVIAAALSMQDPRERPEDQRQRADELHRRFDVPGSDLLSLVELWDHLAERQRELSGNQFRRLCRDEHLNYLRVREWRDLYSQLRRVAGDLGIRPGVDEAHPDAVHRSVLAGLLSHLGQRIQDGREYRGARDARFVIAPGSVLSKRPPTWVMAAELVETSRLFARRVAVVRPEWAERAGAHLVKRSYGDARWDARQGRAVTDETVTLYGLPIVSGRTVGVDRIDRTLARSMFVRHALVAGDWDGRHDFVRRNAEFVDGVRRAEDRVRRVDLVDDEAVEAFFDERIPEHVVSATSFAKWWKRARQSEPHLLDLTEKVLLRDGRAIRLSDYPDEWEQGDWIVPLTYRFAPGEPLDGVTVHVPLRALNQVTAEGFDWQIPGHRDELVAELVATLPKSIRRELIPMADTLDVIRARLGEPSGRLVDRLADVVSDVAGVRVDADDFDQSAVPAHLRLHVVVSDDEGTVHDAGDDLAVIAERLTAPARAAIARASPIEERRGIVEWDLGTLPRVVEAPDGTRGHPTLVDAGDSVSLRIVGDPDLQERAMRGAVRRLLQLADVVSSGPLERRLDNAARLHAAAVGTSPAELVDDVVVATIDRLVADLDELPWDASAFGRVVDHVAERAPDTAADALSAACDALAMRAALDRLLDTMVAESFADTVLDARGHLDRLVFAGFVSSAGVARLPDVLRYLRGVQHRLERVSGDVARDRRRIEEVRPLEERYARSRRAVRRPGSAWDEVRWMLEELRIATFAQQLGTRGPASPKRVDRALRQLGA